MSVLFTDDFNRANGGLGANYTLISSALAIVSNQVTGIAATNCSSYWNGGTPIADCYAKLKIQTIPSGATDSTGLFLRFDPATFNGYAFEFFNGVCRIIRLDAGVSTGLTTLGSNPTNGQVVKLEIVGSQLRCYYDAVLIGSATDATYSAAGRSGLFVIGSAPVIDDYEVGTSANPTINTHPTTQTAENNGTATFTVAATTSGGTLHYQWNKNGSNVGTDSSTYAPTVTASDADQPV